MRIVTWNIKHGGQREHILDILTSLYDHNADVIVLTEFREKNGRIIREKLREKGWVYQVTSQPPENKNGILICSRSGFNTFTSDQPLFQYRSLEILLAESQIRVHAVHIPGISDKPNKKDFWQYLINHSRSIIHERALIIGDFNTGFPIDAQGTPFYCVEYMEELIGMGWTDAWRSLHRDKREYTWYSNARNGFRLDYAFLSPGLKGRLITSSLSHTEREAGYSDHSSLIIEVLDQP